MWNQNSREKWEEWEEYDNGVGVRQRRSVLLGCRVHLQFLQVPFEEGTYILILLFGYRGLEIGDG